MIGKQKNNNNNQLLVDITTPLQKAYLAKLRDLLYFFFSYEETLFETGNIRSIFRTKIKFAVSQKF